LRPKDPDGTPRRIASTEATNDRRDDGGRVIKAHWFNNITAWVMITGIVVVCLAIVVLNLLDRHVIEEAAARNVHAEFLRAASSVSRFIGKSGDIRDIDALKEAFADIFELRPGIRHLSVFEITPTSGKLIFSSDPVAAQPALSERERTEIAAGRSVAQLDISTEDRAWLITAPVMVDGRIVGALRGRFSLWKYDGLIKQEGQLAKDVGIGAVLVTCLVFLALIRIKVHGPVRQLIRAMHQAEAGDLTTLAPVTGPSDLREVAGQFNRMLERVRNAIAEKERLLREVRGFNDMLMTKIAETREELQRTTHLLVEARVKTERTQTLAALGELSAVVAHELGNPLNAISGHLQLLAKEPNSPARQRHLSIIQSEITRMVCIIRHILDSTRMQVRTAPVDLNRVVQEVMTLIFPNLPGRRIVMKAELAPVLPLIAGDQRALHSVMFNLATNAVQAMPCGGELHIRTERVFRGAIEGHVILAGGGDLAVDAVRLTVADTGQGIEPEHLARIAEPFFTTRQSDGGTGLGLAICQRVLSSLGCRLVVQSRIGQGTTFVVDLPIWKASDAEEGVE
jgi:signal transduction histidine kinase